MKKAMAIFCVGLVVLGSSIGLFASAKGGLRIQGKVVLEETTRNLSSKNKTELIKEMKSKLNAGKNIDLGLYVALIIKKDSKNTRGLLKKEIQNSKNTEFTQTTFYDVLISLPSFSKKDLREDIKKILDKKGVCDNVKARIINECTTKQDVKMLKKGLAENSNVLDNHCLKRLYELDNNKGLQIAQELLNEKPYSKGSKLDAARYIIADFIRNNKNMETGKEWLKKCISWYENSNKEIIRRKWGYALSYMQEAEALIAIVNNSETSEAEKQSALSDNSEIVEELDLREKNMSLKSLYGPKIGKLGTAAYRNGVAIIEWHTAIVTDKKPRLNKEQRGTIVHAVGSDYCASEGSWNDFMGKYKFRGFYKAKGVDNKYKRMLIAEMAKKIATYNIPYCVVDMLKVKKRTSSPYILPEYISAIRCDGLIEYCYEYYGLRIQGDDENWDITDNSKGARRAHSTLFSWVSPKLQAKSMDRC